MAARGKPLLNSRISKEAPPNVDPTQTIPAFGDRAVPRVSRELAATNDEGTVQRALFTLCDMLRSPNSVSEALAAGIPQQLGSLLTTSEHAVIKEKASEGLCHFAGHAVGRAAIVSQQLVPLAAEKFLDELAVVRLNTHACIERVSKAMDGAREVLKLGLVPHLVHQAGEEVEVEVKELVLDTLHNASQVDSIPALTSGGIQTYTGLLDHEASSIVWRAARNIMDAAITVPGKDDACKLGVVPKLIELLDGPNANVPEVASAVCAALMTITITTEGKLLSLKHGVVERLPGLLTNKDERVLLAGIKLITTTSEAPAAREALKSVVARLTALTKYRGERLDEMAVARSAQTAIDTITWTP
mmetsp:Transcript_28050/g.73560  ORF Transcript_28050/g.73560 Transcript_28050/m.73560 type:complete len:359 (+) Transcript_28050:109-1185(+)